MVLRDAARQARPPAAWMQVALPSHPVSLAPDGTWQGPPTALSCALMPSLTKQQALLLAALTLIWGLSWPVMKLGVGNLPPLTFRALCFAFSMPVMMLGMRLLRVPFRVPRDEWAQVARLSLPNMMLWHIFIILAVGQLSSGRAAVLGYTMPIFSAVLGGLLFGGRLSARAALAVAATAGGVLLLLWNELSHMSGKPLGVVFALSAALSWALGTQLMRRAQLQISAITLTFWMMWPTLFALATLAWVFERSAWHGVSPQAWWAIAYNALLVLAVGQTVWSFLARTLPPLASTISVMLIPVIGVFSGALFLRERLLWQDYAAVALIVLSVLLVLWPTRAPAATR